MTRRRAPASGPLLTAKRLAKAVIVTVTMGGALFAGGFVLFAAHIASMSTPQAIETADAIVVLTGGQSRLDAGLELLKSGKGRRLLISGVNPQANARDLASVTGADSGLFDCCVDIDKAALDTIGNAEESAKWVRQHEFDSIIVVTNNYHMPRSLMELGRVLDREVLQPYPVVNARGTWLNWISNTQAWRVLFTEYVKYVAAFARGAIGHADGSGFRVITAGQRASTGQSVPNAPD